MEFLLSGIMIIHQLRPEILIFFVGKSCHKKYCSFCQMETSKTTPTFFILEFGQPFGRSKTVLLLYGNLTTPTHKI